MTVEELEVEQTRLYDEAKALSARRKVVAAELDALRRAEAVKYEIANLSGDIKQYIVAHGIESLESVQGPN